MALKQTHHLRQAQSLVMTPKLQQSIQLLEMTNHQLNEFVKDEIEKNPFLDEVVTTETADTQGSENSNTPKRELNSAPENGEFSEQKIISTASNKSSWEPRSFENNSRDTQFKNTNENNEITSITNRLVQGSSLQDHLLMQFNLERHTADEAMIAARLIDAIDNDGYLRTDIHEVASELGQHQISILNVLERIQTLEPTGVGARNLGECFALQLKEINRLDPPMKIMLDNLHLLSKRKYQELQKLCEVSSEELSEMIDKLRHLDPNPGSSFEQSSIQVLIPDVLMRQSSEQDLSWHVELNPEAFPSILLNADYTVDARKALRDKTERQFITDNLVSAKWLIRALEKRASTIIRVAEKIVRKQENFFREGVSALKPMTLKDIARELEVHESTISRTVNGKYIDTPMGIMEFKSFFSVALQNQDGTASSAESVRHRIKELIETENSTTALSDESIARLLSAEGISIARRTVAKYRELMFIPTSAQRKRQSPSLSYKQ